jgi:hypothetical protein
MWRVVIRPYSLTAAPIGLPHLDVRCFNHRSAKGALRRLGALIAGEQQQLAPTTRRVIAISPEGEELSWARLNKLVAQERGGLGAPCYRIKQEAALERAVRASEIAAA